MGQVGQPLGVKAIADELTLVPSTCLHILRVLVSEELVTWDAATKRYALGNGMISLARSVLDRSGFPQLIQPALDRLAGRFGVTAMGVEITSKDAVVLALSHSNQPFRVHTDVGSRFDTLVSATGRLIAAHGGESWTDLRKKFTQIHWDKAPRFDVWKKEVELASSAGFQRRSRQLHGRPDGGRGARVHREWAAGLYRGGGGAEQPAHDRGHGPAGPGDDARGPRSFWPAGGRPVKS